MNYPQSISIIPQQILQDQQITTVESALQNVAGITLTDSPRNAFTSVNIRGFDVFRIFVDGLRFQNTVDETANIERIEVLKGPATLFFGRGNPGGTINIIRKKPLDVPFYQVEASAGSFNFYRTAFDISGPVTPSKNVLYRITGSLLFSESFVDFIRNDRFFVSPSVTWRISDNTDLNFTFEYLDSRYPNERGIPALGTVLPNINGSLPRGRFLGEPTIDQRNEERLRFTTELEHRINQNWVFRNALGAEFTTTRQRSTAPFELLPDQRTLIRGAFIDAEEGVPRNSYVSDTYIRGKFNTGSLEHELLFGFDLSRRDGGNNFVDQEVGVIDIFQPTYNQRLGAILAETSFTTINDEFGIYLRDQIKLPAGFQVLLGGRFEIANQKFIDFLNPVNNTEQQDQAFTPFIGVVYKPIQPISIYANFAQSFEPIAGATRSGDPLQPELGTQYEVGIKAEPNPNLLVTLAYFNITRTNVPTTDPINPIFLEQTGEQRSSGLELEVVGQILPGWNIFGGYALIDAEVTQDNDIPIGNRLANVPRNSVSLWSTYEIQTGVLKGLGFGLGLYYVDQRAGNLANTFELPNYFRTDAAIFYKRDQLRVGLNFYNLFGIDYFVSAESPLRVFPGELFSVRGIFSWTF